MKVRVFEAFAGYGSQSLALERLKRNYPDFDYEVVGISEIDQHAIIAYNAVHSNITNYGDISNIDWNYVDDFDCCTYSFPCTQISRAGQQKGMKRGSGTASSLVWDCLRCFSTKRPKWLLMENVPDIVGDKVCDDFYDWCRELNKLGYENYISILRSQDFGVPQSRSRVFMVSILGGGGYYFPKNIGCDSRLKDVIDYDVDEKYYKDDSTLQKIKVEDSKAETICINSKVNGKQPSLQDRIYDVNGIAPACTCSYLPYIAEPRIVQIGNICEDTAKFHNRTMGRVYSIDGISPTLNTCGGGNREPLIYINARIRKLTPREFLRLQDVGEEDIERIMSVGLSDSAIYKLAGNSITISVLYHIFRKMFCETENENDQLTLF